MNISLPFIIATIIAALIIALVFAGHAGVLGDSFGVLLKRIFGG